MISLVRISVKVLEMLIFILSLFFRYFLSLEKSVALEQTWTPFTQASFVPILAEICPVILENKANFDKKISHKPLARVS